MTASDVVEQRQRIIDASIGQPFAFDQGGSLHVGLLGLVARPSGPHDEASFLSGVWDGQRSHADLDLMPDEADVAGEYIPQLDVWFDGQRTLLDISDAFVGVPAEEFAGSGIPAEVLEGPVAVTRGGDAGDGIMALLTQMCSGRLAVDPAAMANLMASDHVVAFAEHELEDIAPLRAFNAVMPVARFLDEVGLTSTTIVNQIAVLGCDLRTEVGPHAVDLLDKYLQTAPAQLAWLIDEDDQFQTSQVVVNLNDFFVDLFTSDAMIERLAAAEQTTVEDIRAFVDKAAEMGRLAYMNVTWQTYGFDESIDPVPWPDAPDLSADMAGQASRIREQAIAETPAPDAQLRPLPPLPANVTVAPNMIEAMRASSGAMHFVLTNVDGDAVGALEAAQDAVMAVPHPDEPTEGLASFVSDIVETDSGAHFWADISDMEEETEILEALLTAAAVAISSHVVTAHLST